MFCHICGQDLPDAARFCSQCGTNLRGVVVRPTNETTTAATSRSKTDVSTEIIDDGNFKEEDIRTEYSSLPFEFDIIKNFRKKLPIEYKLHVRDRLRDALEDHRGNNPYDILPLEHFQLFEKSISLETVGELAFYFIKINKLHPYLKPTTQMLMELLARVYMKE